MARFWDSHSRWLNEWAAQHARERRGEPFPEDATELWEKLEIWIVNFSYWIVRRDSLRLDPLELAESIRERVLAGSATFEGRSSLTTWLQAVGYRRMLSLIKTKDYSQTAYLEEEFQGRADEVLHENQESQVTLFGLDPANTLDQLLGKVISERDAAIIRARHLDGKTDAEIAAEYHLKVATVHTIVMRSMRRLRLFANAEPAAPGKIAPQRVRRKHAAS